MTEIVRVSFGKVWFFGTKILSSHRTCFLSIMIKKWTIWLARPAPCSKCCSCYGCVIMKGSAGWELKTCQAHGNYWSQVSHFFFFWMEKMEDFSVCVFAYIYCSAWIESISGPNRRQFKCNLWIPNGLIWLKRTRKSYDVTLEMVSV